MKSCIPHTIAVVANLTKAEAKPRIEELAELLRRHGVRVLFETETADLVATKVASGRLADLATMADLVAVLGGDGTILRVVRALQGAPVPLFGINLGSLGFLTSIRSEEMSATVAQIVQGHYAVSERCLLKATWLRGDKVEAEHLALNDAVVARGAYSRIVRLGLSIDGEPLTDYVCDGMIFATATGSTAYSLSAGGPIVLPTARTIVMTPICPHALGNRSVIMGEDSTVRARVLTASGDLHLTMDGQVAVPLQVGDEVLVRRAESTAYLVMPTGSSFLEILRKKLKWSGANV